MTVSERDSFASTPATRRRFQRQGRRDTSPELALRRCLHARGLRYRVDAPVVAGLRRRADIVFPRSKVAVFVDGCFWHSCPDHGTLPLANRTWWKQKLARTVERDRDTDERLARSGWRVIRVWEHESPDDAAQRVAKAVARRR